jgi:hypothetical protein
MGIGGARLLSEHVFDEILASLVPELQIKNDDLKVMGF